VDRTLPPGIPEGEDAGIAVDVAAPDKTGRNNSMANSRGRRGSTGRAVITAKLVPRGRIGEVGGLGQAVRSSVVRAR
jgi:hypothetical protein